MSHEAEYKGKRITVAMVRKAMEKTMMELRSRCFYMAEECGCPIGVMAAANNSKEAKTLADFDITDHEPWCKLAKLSADYGLGFIAGFDDDLELLNLPDDTKSSHDKIAIKAGYNDGERIRNELYLPSLATPE